MPRVCGMDTRASSAARRLMQGALAAAVACLLVALGAASAAAYVDYSGPAYQILAPGEAGSPSSEFATDQGKLYDALTGLKGHVSTKKMEQDYLSEKFGVQGPILRTETTGHPGLEIVRDSHDIPHVFGETRSDVMWGSGWVAAEDRGLLLELGLGPAYVAALGIPGLNPFEMLLTGRSFMPSAESVTWVEEQKQSLIEKGAKGEQVIQDLENWTEGVNAYEQTLPPAGTAAARRVSPTRSPASPSSARSSATAAARKWPTPTSWPSLQAKLGRRAKDWQVFRDLREVNDPEAPTTTNKPFPYDTVPTGPTPGAAVIEPGSASPSR